MQPKNFWKYNFLNSGWEFFTSCPPGVLGEFSKMMYATNPDKFIVMNDEKPTMKVSFG